MSDTIDIDNLAAGLTLPTELSEEVWGAAGDDSVIMRLAAETPLAGVGESVPVIEGNPEAEWIDEPNAAGKGSTYMLGTKVIKPRPARVKILVPRRIARSATRLYDALAERLPGALGRNLDLGALFGPSVTGFDSLAGVDAVSVTAGTSAAAYKGTLTALGKIADAGGDATGFALSPSGEINYLGELDQNDRPIFVDRPQDDGSIGSILARPVHKSRTAGAPGSSSPAVAKTFGFVGDWTRAHYGIVRDSIELRASTEAAVTMGTIEVDVDLGDETGTAEIPHVITPYDRGLVVLIAEAEFGFAHEGDGYFVRLTGPNAA